MTAGRGGRRITVMQWLLRIIALTAALLVLADGTSPPQPSRGEGFVLVRLNDAPFAARATIRV